MQLAIYNVNFMYLIFDEDWGVFHWGCVRPFQSMFACLFVYIHKGFHFNLCSHLEFTNNIIPCGKVFSSDHYNKSKLCHLFWHVKKIESLDTWFHLIFTFKTKGRRVWDAGCTVQVAITRRPGVTRCRVLQEFVVDQRRQQLGPVWSWLDLLCRRGGLFTVVLF